MSDLERPIPQKIENVKKKKKTKKPEGGFGGTSLCLPQAVTMSVPIIPGIVMHQEISARR